jgi:DnaJ-class molecular chaperone
MIEMRIELDLNDEEMNYFRDRTYSLNSGLFAKITRAIERAESFVDDDDSGNAQVDCAGCDGVGSLNNLNRNNVILTTTCFHCGGTGKEYV